MQVLSAFSDGLYVSPAVLSAGTFARKTRDTYFYHFEHGPRSGPYAAVSSVGTTTPGCFLVSGKWKGGHNSLEAKLGCKAKGDK